MVAKPKPITIRGVEYPSQAAAGKALGISHNRVYKAALAGRKESLGLGLPGCVKATVPVTIRGVSYPSLHAAAKALGIAQSNLSRMRRNGTLDNAGLGRNKGKRQEPLQLIEGRDYETRDGRRVRALTREDDGFVSIDQVDGYDPCWRPDGRCDFFVDPAKNAQYRQYDLIREWKAP